MNYSEKLISLLSTSHSAFHAVKNIETELVAQGYTKLDERKNYHLENSGKYYIKRNDTSIISFRLPERVDINTLRFLITATHNDSPTFKLKPQPLLKVMNLLMLETEPYGGGIYSTWLDRPLTIAGRVMVLSPKGLETKLLYIDEDLLEIPNVAIHMNRTVNTNASYNANVDMKPVFGTVEEDFTFDKYLLTKLGLDETYQVISHDLYLVNREKPTLLGKNKEFLASGRLDDLSAAYSALFGYLESENKESISVYASFDNEEVGSLTKQGANSTFLQETLRRIVACFQEEKDDYEKTIARSMLLSIDNAHANHPNHMEYSSPTTKVMLNGGFVIKYNANQTYTSDAYSSSIIKAIAKKENLTYQEYTNRSDLRGGSTLGNISNAEVSLTSVDIGLPQLAMHSSYELMGTKDIEVMVKLCKAYFSSDIDLSTDIIHV